MELITRIINNAYGQKEQEPVHIVYNIYSSHFLSIYNTFLKAKELNNAYKRLIAAQREIVEHPQDYFLPDRIKAAQKIEQLEKRKVQLDRYLVYTRQMLSKAY